MNTDKQLCYVNEKQQVKQAIMDKHFKYQRSSLNIIILNVRSNVLSIDVVLQWNYLHLNLNYSIYVKVNICNNTLYIL